MPKFAYKAKEANGDIKEGFIDAGKESEAISKLKAQKLTPIDVHEDGAGLDGLWEKIIGPPAVTSKDLVLFSRQLSTLVSAGVPIVQSLGILEDQQENPTFKRVLNEVRMDIEAGLSISDALRKHPDAFPAIYTAMIRAGELGGILDTILERLSGFLESSEALKQKVKGAMMYPAIVLTICSVVTIFLLTFVIPTFGKIFEGFGKELPMPTQILLDLSKVLINYWYLIPSIPAGSYYAFKKFYATPNGLMLVDGKVLDAPVFGMILRKVAVAKFTRTLGTLIKSGVPIMQALETVAATAGNAVIEKAVSDARESIREGGRLTDPLKRSGLFPNMVTQMIGVGEETGALDQMLEKIADFYDQEVDTAVNGLTSLIEPIVICVMGVVIGSIVVAMFLPMFEMGSMVE